MTPENQRICLRALTGCTLDAGLLDYYLGLASDAILARAYPFADEAALPERYHRLACEIAAYLILRRGAEGETAHSENGISRSYESAAIPDSMLRGIVPCCGIPGEVDHA